MEHVHSVNKSFIEILRKKFVDVYSEGILSIAFPLHNICDHSLKLKMKSNVNIHTSLQQ